MITTDYTANYYLTNQPVATLVQYSSDKFLRDLFLRNDKLEELKKDIGEDLFASLSDEDRDFILKTEGSIDFGYKINSINLHEIEKILREDYEY